MSDEREEEVCQECKRIGDELDLFLEIAEASLPTELTAGHEGQTAQQVVTSVLIHKMLNRMIIEVGNPFQIMGILQRCVMGRLNVQIIDMRGNPTEPGAPIQPEGPAGAAQPLSDDELLNMPTDQMGNA